MKPEKTFVGLSQDDRLREDVETSLTWEPKLSAPSGIRSVFSPIW